MRTKYIDDVIDSMASKGSNSYEKTSVIRGNHIYKSVWTPFIGEELVVEAEEGNEHDKNVVTVMKDGCVVGHVPRCISESPGSTSNVVAVSSAMLQETKAWSQPRSHALSRYPASI